MRQGSQYHVRGRACVKPTLSSRSVKEDEGKTELQDIVMLFVVVLCNTVVIDVRQADVVTEIDANRAHRYLIAYAEDPGKIGSIYGIAEIAEIGIVCAKQNAYLGTGLEVEAGAMGEFNEYRNV